MTSRLRAGVVRSLTRAGDETGFERNVFAKDAYPGKGSLYTVTPQDLELGAIYFGCSYPWPRTWGHCDQGYAPSLLRARVRDRLWLSVEHRRSVGRKLVWCRGCLAMSLGITLTARQSPQIFHALPRE